MQCFFQRSLHNNWRMGRHIVMTKPPVTPCPRLQPFSSYCVPQLAKHFDVVFLSYWLAWRSILTMDKTFMTKKKCTWPWCYLDLVVPSSDMATQTTSIGRTGLLFRDIDIWLISRYDLYGEIWVFVSGFKQVLCNLSTKFLLLLWQEPRNKYCCHAFLAKILRQNLWNNSPWNSQCFF